MSWALSLHPDAVFVSDKREAVGTRIFGVDVVDFDKIGNRKVVIALADHKTRREIVNICKKTGHGFSTLIAPNSAIGKDVSLSIGGIISQYSCITASAIVGEHFHANIYSYVAHDCIIGDYVTFAPRVCCNGHVHIGDGAYVGTGAVLKPGSAEKPLLIGAGSIVGMGAVVTSNVPEGAVVIGNPARIFAR